MIKGTGVDMVEISRIRRAVERHGERFLLRIYSRSEIEYCRSSARPFESYAARFAAKEAVLKALGVGWQHGACFTDIVIDNDEMGAPGVRLSGKSLQISSEAGISAIYVSLSHTAAHAIAFAVAEG